MVNPAEAALQVKLKKYRWPAFIIAVFAYMLATFQRMAPAVMGPELIADLRLDAVDFGLLGLTYMWTYALAQAPMGALIDRFGARRGLAAVLFLTAAGCLLFSVAASFPLAVAGRMLVAFAVAGFIIIGAKVVAGWYSAREYPVMWGLFMGLGTLGAVGATAPLQFMLSAFGWRQSFVIIAALSALLGGLAYLFVRDRPAAVGLPAPDDADGRTPATPAQAGNWRKNMLDICRQPRFLLLGLYFVGLNASSQAIVSLWGGVYMASVYGLSKTVIADILTLCAVFMVSGSVATGWMIRRLGTTGVMLTGASAFFAAWLYMTFNVRTLTVPELTVIMSTFGFTMTCTATAGFALVKEWVAADKLGTAMGLVNGFCWFFGAGLFQQLWGIIIKHLSRGASPYPAAAFQGAMWLQAIVLGVSVACALYFARRGLRRRKAGIRGGMTGKKD